MSEELIPYDPMRPTEWLAVFAILCHYIPSSAYGRHYASPPDVYRRGQTNLTRRSWWEGLTLIQTEHLIDPKKFNGKVCGNCGQRLPAIDYYWPRNPQGKDGLHSMCKYCRREADRERYRIQKALCN